MSSLKETNTLKIHTYMILKMTLKTYEMFPNLKRYQNFNVNFSENNPILPQVIINKNG